MTLRLGGDGAITGCTSLEEPTISISGLTMTTPIEAVSGTAAAPSYTFSGDTDNGLYYAGTNSIGLSTAGSNAILIDSAGRVGIGVTPPNYGSGRNSLDIHSSGSTITHFGITNSTTGSGGASNGFNIIQNGLDTQLFLRESGFMSFSTAATERMRIDSSGDIELYSGSTDGSYKVIRGKHSVGNEFNRSEVRFGVENNANGLGFLAFATGNNTASEQMRIDSSGKLVVGATSFISGANSFTQAMISGGDGGLIINSTNTSATSYCRLMFTPNGHITGNEGMIRYNTNDYHMAFWTQGNERMRIDSSGTLVIGRTASSDPNRYVQIHNGSAASSAYLQSTNTGTGSGAADGIVMGMGDATNAYFWNYENGAIIFATNGTQRALFDSSGNLLVGKSGSNFAVQGVEIRGGGEITLTRQGDLLTTRRITTEGTHMSIRAVGGTVIGTISTNGTNASFNDLSDYRFKENIIALSNGIERIKLLKPSQYNFISNSSSTIDGFLAHEVQAVVPEAVTGEKDAIDENGEVVSQMLDRSKLIPLLTAALQEAIDKIETLEAKVAALET